MSRRAPKSTVTPTARTLDLLRKRGYRAGVVERWIGGPELDDALDSPDGRHRRPHKVRVDFCGWGDIIAYKGADTLGIQCTSVGGMSHRMLKYKRPKDEHELNARQALRDWLEGGHRRFVLIGWTKYDQRVGGRLWRETEVELTFAALDTPDPVFGKSVRERLREGNTKFVNGARPLAVEWSDEAGYGVPSDEDRAAWADEDGDELSPGG